MFENREEAGRAVAGLLRRYQGHDLVVVAVARGGVPVGYAVSRELRAPLDVTTPRKLPVPGDPEAGFGAVAPGGGVVLNEDLVSRLGLGTDQVGAIAETVAEEVGRREREYHRGRGPVPLRGRMALVVDDGLATGYTMLAAVGSVMARGASRVAVAVPCASGRALDLVSSRVEEVYCVARSDEPVFAVASFYDEFPDLTDGEVVTYLELAGGAS